MLNIPTADLCGAALQGLAGLLSWGFGACATSGLVAGPPLWCITSITPQLELGSTFTPYCTGSLVRAKCGRAGGSLESFAMGAVQ